MATDETVGEEFSEPASVLLLLAEGRDRTLLADWLGSFPEYEVVTAESRASLPEYDLCLVHEPLLDDVRSTLTQRRAAADPVYLPHLLLLSRETQSNRDPSAAVDWELVDDVVALPVDQTALKRRMGNLFQARKASLRLAEREDQYRQLVELTPEGVFLLEDETILYANTVAVEMLRVTDGDDLEGRSISEFVVARDREDVQSVRNTVAGDEQTTTYTEVEMQTATGDPVPASVAGVEVTYDGRAVTQLVVRDLRERKQRQRRLDLFGRAIEAAAQGITIADAQQEDAPLVYANDAFERITGYPPADVLGRNCRFLQGEHTDEESVAEIRRGLEADEPVSVELLNYRRDGTPFWNHLDVVPVTDDNGQVTHYLGLQRDITARKEREQRVAVLDRVLRHNLRNQTSVIRGYADLLSEDVPPEQVQSEIRDAADELLSISEQVRAFRSVVTGDDTHRIDVDLVETVGQAIEGVRDETRENAITLSGPGSAMIRADPTLPSALRDLIELAVQVDDPDVSIELTEENGRVLLEFVDRAGAIPTDDLRIVGGDVETPLEHLQGVGLWLIRWSVEQSSGEFSVDLEADPPVIQVRFPTART